MIKSVRPPNSSTLENTCFEPFILKNQDFLQKRCSSGKLFIKLFLSGAILITSGAFIGCSAKKGLGKGQGAAALEASEAGLGAEDTSAGLSEYDLSTQQAARYGEGTIPTAERSGLFRDIFFDYDSSAVSPEAQQDIEANASLLKQNPTMSIQLEGHCDARGTEEYNIALGDYRAKAVGNALVALGVSPRQLQPVSYGENIPLDSSSSDYALAQNRRVHFAAASTGDGTPRARMNNEEAY
jgi:peptidoglycan-associated lipoprotein